MRRGTSGLKRYLLDRLHREKEVFRQEIGERDQLKAKDTVMTCNDGPSPCPSETVATNTVDQEREVNDALRAQ